MDDLIEALQIFRKYKNSKYPTSCGHDVLVIMDVERDEVSSEDLIRLDELDFFWDEEFDGFASFHFGSA